MLYMGEDMGELIKNRGNKTTWRLISQREMENVMLGWAPDPKSGVSTISTTAT